MKYNITDALQALKPGQQWVLRGTEYSGLEWLDSGQTQPTEEEVANELTKLDAAEPMRLLRHERDKRIALTDWRASSDLTITDAWKTYRQALRDLPQTAGGAAKLDSEFNLDLSSIPWPEEPK